MRVPWLLLLSVTCALVLPVGQLHAAPAIDAKAVWVHTNIERYRAGLPLLGQDPQLAAVAERKMRDLFTRQYFAHDAPTGEDVSDLADDAGYAYLAVGENLALGDFRSSKDVVDAWMESPGHRANILSRKFSEIGIAAGRSTYEGTTAWIVVQSFGLPRTSCPPIDEDDAAALQTLETRLTMLERVLLVREQALDDARRASRRAYNDAAARYNTVAALYNSTVERYRALADEYNTAVDAFNACLEARTSA